jgi:hypothetical protein
MADNRVKNMMIATWGIETVADYYKYDKSKKYEEYKYTLASKYNSNEIYYTKKINEDNYVINYP